MIPFFRKIRKQLADDNKPIKYLRYAIGEIILVVIGILIALQINNANENRKNDEKIISIFKEIQRELAYNINRTTNSLDIYKKKDSLISLILQNKVTKLDYQNDPNYSALLFNYSVNDVHNNGYFNLNNNLNIIPVKYNFILEKLNTVFERDNLILDRNQNWLLEFVQNYKTSLSDSKEWYSDFINNKWNNNFAWEYFLNDPFYKNKVSDLRTRIWNLQLSRNKINSLKAYKALAEITGKNDDIPSEIYFRKKADLLKFEGDFIINEPSEFYIAEDKSDKLIFRVDENKIFMKIFGNQEHELFPHTKNTFILNDGDNTQIIFNQNKKGNISGLIFLNINVYTKWIKVK